MSRFGGGVITTFKTKYEGEDIADYHNNHGEVPHDSVVRKLMPSKVCECSLARSGAETCMRGEIIERIARPLGVTSGGRAAETLRALMKKTGCDSERCVLDVARSVRALSASEAGIEEQIAFKRGGPTDTSLLNDGAIGAQMYAWMYQFADFWAYNFNMLNFAQYSLADGAPVARPDTLARLSWTDLYAGRIPDPVGMNMTPSAQEMMAAKRRSGVRCGGCIVNSDVYDGGGKHWMALFVDARADGDAPAWTVEFFNSAAVRPESEWVAWMVKTKHELQAINPRARISLVYVCRVWHQHTKSECGAYSLFYIWARLNGVAPSYFLENVVPDQIMFEFRQHLFNDRETGPFDYARFAGSVKIRWDTENLKSGKRTNM